MTNKLDVIHTALREIDAVGELTKTDLEGGGYAFQGIITYKNIQFMLTYSDTTQFANIYVIISDIPDKNFIPIYRHMLSNSCYNLFTNFAIDETKKSIILTSNISLSGLDAELASFIKSWFDLYANNAIALGQEIQNKFNLS